MFTKQLKSIWCRLLQIESDLFCPRIIFSEQIPQSSSFKFSGSARYSFFYLKNLKILFLACFSVFVLSCYLQYTSFFLAKNRTKSKLLHLQRQGCSVFLHSVASLSHEQACISAKQVRTDLLQEQLCTPWRKHGF